MQDGDVHDHQPGRVRLAHGHADHPLSRTSAILGLGAIEKRPKVITGPDGEDTIAIRTCAYFSLSFDHRIVDGSDADKFLAFLKKQLETFPDAGA